MATEAFALAIGIGAQVLTYALKPKKKDSWSFGPRLSDLNVPTVSPGNEIQRVWGTIKVPTQTIWCSRLIETPHLAMQKQPGGKGGGKGGATSYTVSYTFSVNVAAGICRGPIAQVNRIWAQGKLLWTNPTISAADIQASFDAAYISEGTRLIDLGVTYEEAAVSAYIFAYNAYEDSATLTAWTQVAAGNYIQTHPLYIGAPAPNMAAVYNMLAQMFDPVSLDKKFVPTKIRYDSITIYRGDDFQEPDATMQAALGADNVPAYRGLAYFVVTNLQLADFGNTIPQFTVEVVKDGDISYETVAAGDFNTIHSGTGGSGTLALPGGGYVSTTSASVTRVTSKVITLSQIIKDILSEAGLPDDSYDASTNIPSDVTVSGYAITQTASTRQLLQDLQKVFVFDGTESGWKIKFQILNKRAVAVLNPKDFGAHQDKDDLPPSFEQTRASELDMPRRINLKYQEPNRNYSPNTVWSERQTGNSLTVEDIELPIALDRAVAKELIEQVMVQRFLGRNSYKVSLPRKYIIFEPGDVVLVPNHLYPDEFQAWRVEEITIGADGRLEFTFCDSDYVEGSLAAIVGSDIDVTAPKLPSNSRTYAYMLDTSLLSDAIPDDPQFFVVMSGVTPGWKSGGLLVDLSDAGDISAFGETGKAPVSGSNWFSVASAQQRVPHGFAIRTLDPTVKPGSWDLKSEVIVYLLDNTWTLTNADPADMMTQPLNTCWINGEICAFANATDLGNGKWKLTKWLRGLRGTEYAIPKHSGTEQFVRLNGDALQRVVQTQDALNKKATYVALSSGEVVGDEPTFEFTNTGNSLRPYSPAITDTYKDESGNFTVNWQPRNRINGGWSSGGDIVLDQAVEAYEIDVVTVVAGVDVVHKTYSLGAVRTWTYSAAAQTTDTGGTTGIFLNIYQIGAIVGRGFPSRVGV